MSISAAAAAEESQARRKGGVDGLLQEVESSNALAVHIDELWQFAVGQRQPIRVGARGTK